MNTQARKIWDALNPKLSTSKGTPDLPGLGVPEPRDCLLAIEGGVFTLVLDANTPNLDIHELHETSQMPMLGGPRRFLVMKPARLAWLVSRAADALRPAGETAADAFVRDLRYKRPVNA